MTLERMLGPVSDDAVIARERERREAQRKGPRARGLFSGGRIARRESPMRLERRDLFFEAATILGAENNTSEEIMEMIENLERPASRDEYYNRNRDPNDDDDEYYDGPEGPGGGFGGGGHGGGGGYGGGAGGVGTEIMV